jgi:hypothetical protein
MIHLQWETTASPEGDAVSPTGDLLASPNFGICDTAHLRSDLQIQIEITSLKVLRVRFRSMAVPTNIGSDGL